MLLNKGPIPKIVHFEHESPDILPCLFITEKLERCLRYFSITPSGFPSCTFHRISNAFSSHCKLTADRQARHTIV